MTMAYERDKQILASSDAGARRRMAMRGDVAPELLFFLSGDPCTEVRAAVAANDSAPPQAESHLASDMDPRVRVALAQRLARLAPDLSDIDQDRIRRLRWQTLVRLVQDAAATVRAAIADAVKAMPRAPRQLILALARDTEPSVADPIIRLSPLLTDNDLIALIAAPPAEDTVATVARRAGLSAAVSDAIVETGVAPAIAALLANGSAAIREATLDRLISGAAKETSWCAPLVHRPRLPPKAAQALAGIVADDLLDAFAARADLDTATMAALRRRVGQRLARLNRDEDESAVAVPTETALMDAIGRGDTGTAAAILATVAAMPRAAVDRASQLRSAKALVALCWKAGFSMRTAMAVQTGLGHIASGATLMPTAAGTYPLATAEMEWQLQFLTRLAR